MKSVFKLFGVLFALLALTVPVQAGTEFVPGNERCENVNTQIYYYEIEDKKVPFTLRKQEAICRDYSKNSAKYNDLHKKSTKGKSLFEMTGFKK